MLHLKNVSFQIGQFALRDISFSIDKGDYFVLLGESGTGKTIILELLAGIHHPKQGTIVLNEKKLENVPIQKRDIGLVYQNRALFPHMSVRENIGYALPRKQKSRVNELAAMVGATHLLDREPTTLSAGEGQRVALARTLAMSPSLLLLDEPLAALDVASSAEIRSLLRQLHQMGETIIHVTHDYDEALALATKVAVLEEGRISQFGSPDEVFHKPRSKFVATFVGIKNFFRGELSSVSGANLSTFRSGLIEFAVPAINATGMGCIVFKAEDVVLSLEQPRSSSTRNVLKGTINDFEKVPNGIEIQINVGAPIYAIITYDSLISLGLKIGMSVWVSVKATCIRFVQGGNPL